MSTQSINYVSLNKPIKPVYLWLELCCLAIILSTVIGVYMTNKSLWYSDSSQASIAGIGFLITILLAVTFACIYLYTYNRRHDKKLEAFAKDNSWQRVKRNHDSATASTLEEMFDNITVSFDIEGTYNQLPMRLCHIECTPENLNIFFNIICLIIDLVDAMPFIILMSKTEKLDIANIFAAKPNNGRMLQLEGNFKDTYRLFVKENAERNVLEILTPDVMEELIDIQNPSSITLNDGELCLFLQADDFTENKLTRLFSTADVVINGLK